MIGMRQVPHMWQFDGYGGLAPYRRAVSSPRRPAAGAVHHAYGRKMDMVSCSRAADGERIILRFRWCGQLR